MAPPRKKPAVPTKELGISYPGAQGVFPWDSFTDLIEYVPELTWPNSVRIYDQMRNNTQIHGLHVLTFINPATPGTQHANGTVQFAFKVDNHTPSSQSYAWTVTTQPPGRAPIDAATGHFTLPTYYFAVVPVHVRVVCTGTRSRITVSLGSAPPAIGFWWSCPSNRP
jgi:hypothetical protein